MFLKQAMKKVKDENISTADEFFNFIYCGLRVLIHQRIEKFNISLGLDDSSQTVLLIYIQKYSRKILEISQLNPQIFLQ